MVKEQVYDTPRLDTGQRTELLRRAYAAWFKGGGKEMPNAERSGVKVRLRLVYVVLHGAAGVLVVYRVRPDNLALRAMKRWPESVGK
jgi:hypothetical protein